MKILKMLAIAIMLTSFTGCASHLRTQSDPTPGIELPAGTRLVLPAGDPSPALCCGSCDSNDDCSNCSFLHPFSDCRGVILACPDGEFVTEDGVGGCA